LPATILLTRLGPVNHVMDSDGLSNALKQVRDAVAEHYGIDDGDKSYDWQYAQERAKEYGVRITIRPLVPQPTE
jgi:hypothetical protein